MFISKIKFLNKSQPEKFLTQLKTPEFTKKKKLYIKVCEIEITIFIHPKKKEM